MSFTAAGLALPESLKIAEVYLDCLDWDATKEQVISGNLIQARTNASLARVFQEVRPRLEGLREHDLELLLGGTPAEQRQVLWYAVCKRYAYIHDFAVDVLHEKFLQYQFELTAFDYLAFFNRKADWHDELDQLKDSSRKKVETVLFRMLREAGLLTKEHKILPAVLSAQVWEMLRADNPDRYRIFPVNP